MNRIVAQLTTDYGLGVHLGCLIGNGKVIFAAARLFETSMAPLVCPLYRLTVQQTLRIPLN
jgi:hypothetical protein